jgi:hypothetical protein
VLADFRVILLQERKEVATILYTRNADAIAYIKLLKQYIRSDPNVKKAKIKVEEVGPKAQDFADNAAIIRTDIAIKGAGGFETVLELLQEEALAFSALKALLQKAIASQA